MKRRKSAKSFRRIAKDDAARTRSRNIRQVGSDIGHPGISGPDSQDVPASIIRNLGAAEGNFGHRRLTILVCERDSIIDNNNRVGG